MIPAPRSPAEDDAHLDVTAMTVEELRHQRRLLAGELRGVRYWRRIAQAQTDLLVAGLVYHGREDVDGLHSDGGPSRPGPDPGERLVRLRERSRLMGGYERTLSRDLDNVTTELAGRLTAHQNLASPPTAG